MTQEPEKSIPSEIWECSRCKRWAFRLPVSAAGVTGDKDWSCDGCGCTSIRLRGPGRPIGPRSRHWKWAKESDDFAKEWA